VTRLEIVSLVESVAVLFIILYYLFLRPRGTMQHADLPLTEEKVQPIEPSLPQPPASPMRPQKVYTPPRIAFCITCKGRAQHVKLTLPKNLADNADYENCVFVLLDYESPDDLRQYIRAQHSDAIASGKLVVYSFHNGGGPFHMAHAKNMAHRCGLLEGADILVNLDADNFTGAGFATYIAEQFKSEPNVFLWSKMVKGVLPRGINGRMVVSRHAFLNAGGYDEQFNTWSHDDRDFNLRLRRLGYQAQQIHPRYLDAVRHTDKMRFKEYPHAEKASYDEPTEWLMSSEITIVNWGNFGCGTVYRDLDFTDIGCKVLKPLPSRIFGIGMHKTATTSLHHAMRFLGFNSAHWTSAHWAKAIWTEMRAEGRSLTVEKHYHLCDLPIPMLFRELDKAYPGSKFILTMLDEEVWVKAAEVHWSPRNRFRNAWDSDPFSHQVHQALYGIRHFDREIFLARYRKHNADVLEYFKDRPQDLLVMKMSEGAGWAELCRFVDRPVPEMKYPHSNADIDIWA
jgi:Sulfotransferase domain